MWLQLDQGVHSDNPPLTGKWKKKNELDFKNRFTLATVARTFNGITDGALVLVISFRLWPLWYIFNPMPIFLLKEISGTLSFQTQAWIYRRKCTPLPLQIITTRFEKGIWIKIIDEDTIPAILQYFVFSERIWEVFEILIQSSTKEKVKTKNIQLKMEKWFRPINSLFLVEKIHAHLDYGWHHSHPHSPNTRSRQGLASHHKSREPDYSISFRK